MERKQGFFSALRGEVMRGVSPKKSRSKSPAERSNSPMSRARKGRGSRNRENPEHNSKSETLSPLIEGPNHRDCRPGDPPSRWAQWMKGNRFSYRAVEHSYGGSKRSDLRLLLGVLGAPLAPLHVGGYESIPHISVKDSPIEASSAKYILQQYSAASGGQKVLGTLQNAYAMGKLRMIASEFETTNKQSKSKGSSKSVESGGFVLWQMKPDLWYVELALGDSKVHAGCNGSLVWRHTPWLGAHAAKGPVRPLRRALQGLDPRTTASIFANARCIGEKKINDDECFILKINADPATLKNRSEGPAEIIRHVLFGYFSQRTGLLVHLEDSHLTRIHSNGADAVYWETTINSFLDDYRAVDGVMIAHSGRSVVTLFRFGDTAASHTRTRMEEAWVIEEVAFNVPGLSVDCFIPPAELRVGDATEDCVGPRMRPRQR